MFPLDNLLTAENFDNRVCFTDFLLKPSLQIALTFLSKSHAFLQSRVLNQYYQTDISQKCKWCSLGDKSYGWAQFDIQRHIQCNYVASGEEGRTCDRDQSVAYSETVSTPTTVRCPAWETMTISSLTSKGPALILPPPGFGPQQHVSLPTTPLNKVSNCLGEQKNASLSPEAPSFVPNIPSPPVYLDPRLQSYHEGCHFVPPAGPSKWQGRRQHGNGCDRGGLNNGR